jgi:hypothetical protein
MWFLLLLFFIFASPIHAQDASASAIPTSNPFPQYQQDYLYQYSLYQQAYIDYTNKKQIFAKYGTVTTQNDELLAAVTAINARSRVFKSYLMALRVMLDSYKSVNPDATTAAQTSLSNWENWFGEQLAVVSAINNTHDLQLWVKNFQTKYTQIQQAIYTALVLDELNLRQLTLNQVQFLVSDMQTNSHLKPDSQQWTQSFTDKSNLVSASLKDALSLTKKNQTLDHFSNFYPSAKTDLNQSKNYLIGIAGDLKLIIIKFYQP